MTHISFESENKSKFDVPQNGVSEQSNSRDHDPVNDPFIPHSYTKCRVMELILWFFAPALYIFVYSFGEVSHTSMLCKGTYNSGFINHPQENSGNEINLITSNWMNQEDN